MRTIICNSLQSFWDMADNQFLAGMHVHCVFPTDDKTQAILLNLQDEYKIRNISFSEVFSQH